MSADICLQTISNRQTVDAAPVRSAGKKGGLTQRASIHLDMARGLAALAVLAGHVRGLFFVPFHELSHHSVALGAFYAATALGHQSVMVFFVLSGFLIVSSILSAFDRGQWSWTTYLVNRIVRLSLVLVPALILCWAVDQIGMSVSSTAPLYHRPVESFFATSVAHMETFRNFIGTFFYVQNILVQPFGSDGPLWSLSYEFWYYVVFPLAFCALAAKVRGWVRAVYLVAAALVLIFVGRDIALYFLIWLGGGIVALSSVRRHARARMEWINAMAVVPFICLLGFSISRPLNSSFVTDAAVAIGFAAWIYWLVGMPERQIPPLYAKAARVVAGCSYTLYLTHFPLVFLIRARILDRELWQPDLIHTLYAGLICAVVFIAAYGLAKITEEKTALVRRTVMGLLQQGR